jgi:hypothetical protein
MVVANGDCLTSPGRCCRQLRIAVVTEVFVGDCFGLALGSCDMVLGVQWLEPLVPILWHLARRPWRLSTMATNCSSRRLMPQAPLPPLTLRSTETDLMTDLLLSSLLCSGALGSTTTAWARICLLSGMPPVLCARIDTPMHRRSWSVSTTRCCRIASFQYIRNANRRHGSKMSHPRIISYLIK